MPHAERSGAFAGERPTLSCVRPIPLGPRTVTEHVKRSFALGAQRELCSGANVEGVIGVSPHFWGPTSEEAGCQSALKRRVVTLVARAFSRPG